MRLDERREVLARLERRDREHVRPPEIATLAVGREARRRHPGRRRGCARAATPSVSATSSPVKRELTITTSHVRAACAVLRAVHAPRPRVHPLGEVQRHEVVDHRRANAAALRRIHPVAEVEHVEARRRRAPPAGRPTRLHAVRSACAAGTTGSRRSTAMPVERRLDLALAAPARRRERDDLVLPPASARPRSEPRM